LHVNMNPEKGKECSTTFSVLMNTEPLSKLTIKNPRKKKGGCSTTFSVLMNTEPLSKLAIKNPRKK
jgi:hypothetical protein